MGDGEPRRSARTLSVLVIDDDAAYRAAVAEAIEATHGLALAGTANGVVDGLHAAQSLRPDVVVVDVRMADGGGARVARELSAGPAGCRVLAVSAHTDPVRADELLAAGADAFLAKGGGVEELLDAIRSLGG